MVNTRYINWYEFEVDDTCMGDTSHYDHPGSTFVTSNIVLPGYTCGITDCINTSTLDNYIKEVTNFIARMEEQFYSANEIEYQVPYSLLFQQKLQSFGKDYAESEEGVLWTTLYGLEREAAIVARREYPHVCQCNCRRARIEYY